MPLTPNFQNYRALLERGRWFSLLPEARREQLLEQALLQKLPAGATVFRRGDPNAGLYCVIDGAVRIGTIGAGSREALLSVLGPSQWFGEIAFLDGGARTHDADAKVALTLLLVPRAALERLLAEDPSWWRHLGQLLAEKVRALFASIEDMSMLPAPARVARRLLAMARGHGMMAPGAEQRMVSLNQDQLGAMLSLSRQTVSEILRDFEARGLVKRHYGAIELLDRSTLEAEGESL